TSRSLRNEMPKVAPVPATALGAAIRPAEVWLLFWMNGMARFDEKLFRPPAFVPTTIGVLWPYEISRWSLTMYTGVTVPPPPPPGSRPRGAAATPPERAAGRPPPADAATPTSPPSPAAGAAGSAAEAAAADAARRPTADAAGRGSDAAGRGSDATGPGRGRE